MAQRPSRRERICDALESCRPGSDDLFSPELANVAKFVETNPRWEDVYERIQNIDLKISAAFHDVEIPADLEPKLLASLANPANHREGEVSAAPQESPKIFMAPSVSQESLSLRSPLPQKRTAVSRRWLFAAGGILSAAAALFFVIFYGLNNAGDYSKQKILTDALGFFAADIPAEQGRLLKDTPAPKKYPFSKAVGAFRGIRWREVSNFLGRSAVAFDLPAEGDARATLYVVEGNFPDLDSLPTMNPSNTGGCCVSAWRENGLIYVLVVQGNRKSYEEYLNLPRGPMA